MKINGSFQAEASVAQLRQLITSPEVLDAVPSLRGVIRSGPQTLTMIFAPRVGLGPIPLDTRVTIIADAGQSIELAVSGRRGTQAVDVALTLDLAACGSGTDVSWRADVTIRGGIASVGQRVAGDLARRAIGDVLSGAAQAAAGIPA